MHRRAPRNTRWQALAVGAFVWTCMTTAAAGEDFTIPDSVSVLSSDQIRQTLVGNQLSGVNKGTEWSEAFLPYGTIVGKWGGKTYIASWSLSESVLCLDYESSRFDSCNAVSLDGDGVILWKEDGSRSEAMLARVPGDVRSESVPNLEGEWIFDGEDAQYTRNKPAIVVIHERSKVQGFWANVFELGQTRCDRGLKWFAGRLDDGTEIEGDRWTCGSKRYDLDASLLDDGRIRVMVRSGDGSRIPTWLIRYDAWLAKQK